MPSLYVMCGIPASGKSTLAKEMKDSSPKTIKWVSRDDIRFSLMKSGDDYFKNETQVFKTFCDNINLFLSQGYSVIADATHVNKKSRRKLLKNIHVPCDEIIAVYVDYPINECMYRNSKRSGKYRVPEHAMRRMIDSFEIPDESEGFTHILHTNKEA